MSIQRFINEYTKIVGEEIERDSRAILEGSALDYAQYQYKVGRLAGLAKLHACIEIAEKAVNRD